MTTKHFFSKGFQQGFQDGLRIKADDNLLAERDALWAKMRDAGLSGIVNTEATERNLSIMKGILGLFKRMNAAQKAVFKALILDNAKVDIVITKAKPGFQQVEMRNGMFGYEFRNQGDRNWSSTLLSGDTKYSELAHWIIDGGVRLA